MPRSGLRSTLEENVTKNSPKSAKKTERMTKNKTPIEESKLKSALPPALSSRRKKAAEENEESKVENEATTRRGKRSSHTKIIEKDESTKNSNDHSDDEHDRINALEQQEKGGEAEKVLNAKMSKSNRRAGSRDGKESKKDESNIESKMATVKEGVEPSVKLRKSKQLTNKVKKNDENVVVGETEEIQLASKQKSVQTDNSLPATTSSSLSNSIKPVKRMAEHAEDVFSSRIDPSIDFSALGFDQNAIVTELNIQSILKQRKQAMKALQKKAKVFGTKQHSTTKPSVNYHPLPSKKFNKGPVQVALLQNTSLSLRPAKKAVANFKNVQLYGRNVRRMDAIAFSSLKAKNTFKPALGFRQL